MLTGTVCPNLNEISEDFKPTKVGVVINKQDFSHQFRWCVSHAGVHGTQQGAPGFVSKDDYD